MKKFLLGYVAGFATRHLLFPNATSTEVTDALTDAVKNLNERLDKKDTPVGGQNVTPDDIRIVDESPEETP